PEGGRTGRNRLAWLLRATDYLNLTVLVEGDAGQFAVVLGEVDGDDDDVVLRHAVGGQAGDEEVDDAKRALDDGGPGLARVDAHRLGDPDARAGLELAQERRQGGAHRARRGRQGRGGVAHSTSP